MTEFLTTTTATAVGPNLPQRMGGRLWKPMLAMALMAFPIGFVIHLVKANQIADSGEATTIAGLQHVGTGVMWIGFLAVFAAVSFAVAKILGEFRTGGSVVQEATGSKVVTLRMPNTVRLFIGTMMMGVMLILGSVIVHFVIGAGLLGGDAAALEGLESASIRLEAFRRLGTVLYLFGIAFGLGTIIHVIRFQTIRIRQLPEPA
ncbi:MAG: hypothetical protein HKO76_04735 [Acidimicrobiia bacterium]|nr:hypothetical protein [Acidimicrobiia bacterium]